MERAVSTPAAATTTAGRRRSETTCGGSWSLTVTLAVTDFKLRFFGSALGYVWTLMRPLLLFGVLYLVFTEVVRFGDGVKHYPVYLLAAIVLFTFFSETTSRGVTSLVERENLLQEGALPAPRDPARGGAARALQPRAEPHRRVRRSCSRRASSRGRAGWS